MLLQQGILRNYNVMLRTWEYGLPRQELCQDAPQAPHVNGRPVGQAQNDLQTATPHPSRRVGNQLLKLIRRKGTQGT